MSQLHHHNLKHQIHQLVNKNTYCVLSILFVLLIILLDVNITKAEGVNMSADVLPQHVYESINKTINDFDLSNLNQENSTPTTKMVAGAASTSPRPNVFVNVFNKILSFFKNIF